MKQEIKADRAKAAHTRLTRLLGADVESALEAGRQLDAIQSENLWVDLGAPSWRVYCERKLGVTTGWAYGRIQIHAYFGDEDPTTLPSVQKLFILCRLFRDPAARANKKMWLDKARRSTCPQLLEAVGRTSGRSETRTTWGVALSESERIIVESAIDEARKAGATTTGNALAMVADTFLSQKKTKRSAA